MTLESQKIASVANGEAGDEKLPEPFRTWNATRSEYPRNKSVARLFEEIVSVRSGSVAVVFGEQRLTYHELNVRANCLAHRLRHLGVREEVMVGCCIDRSLELIIALVAILKAGGAYVPLDPSYPKERFDLMLEDTNPKIILTQKSYASTVLKETSRRLLYVDDLDESSSSSDANPPPVSGPESLAYVMYTSGSTGKPKGVMIDNRAIIRLVRDTNYCRFGSEEVFVLFAPVAFDASTFEIWGPLLNGGRLVVMPPRASSLDELGRVLRENGVTTLFLTTAFFNLMVDQRLEDLIPIRQLFTGGEFVSPRHFRMVHEYLPNCALYHVYGPTENTTFSTYYPVPRDHVSFVSIPIGRPISNARVYILDATLRPVPVGESGEIYTAGDGVARGYLNNPDETAEKFLPDPFAANPGERMYRTGDLARWTEDGNVEFLGRIDNQVKILGHRIEPGEIETVLTMHPGVKHVSVVAQTDENGTKRLIAYYACSSETGPTPRELRQFLQGKLPQYMVPSLFVALESLPLSTNGKVDRSALPAPVFGAADGASAEAPTNDTDKTVLDLWRRVLRVERVGLDDNFFDIGGDSLLLVAVHSNLQKLLNIEIPVTDLFEYTTVRTLGKHLREQNPAQPSFSGVQQQAQKQREAFARKRERHGGGAS
ncbi:MAG TPA: non-ribosomal peptide synthetase [Candidatus Sulfotelmatobacter sp.]|jgi:amino acid adenylation domain-containing protein|nr:non-ribosomal peptide synthetase [Candidatus Sulfotelmatobacter sp.]